MWATAVLRRVLKILRNACFSHFLLPLIYSFLFPLLPHPTTLLLPFPHSSTFHCLPFCHPCLTFLFPLSIATLFSISFAPPSSSFPPLASFFSFLHLFFSFLNSHFFIFHLPLRITSSPLALLFYLFPLPSSLPFFLPSFL